MRAVSSESKPMLTVKALRAFLVDCPDEAIVWCEGCDCWGEAGAVVLDDEDAVLIKRHSKP